jgi:type IV pilus assembly protein PilX
MNIPKRSMPARRQNGAALVVGLLLLLVLTVLAVSGMNTATVELQMAGNMQYSQNAFQAAEIGIERVIKAGGFDTSATPTPVDVPIVATDHYRSASNFEISNGITPVPTGGYSMGAGTGFSAYHFDVTSTGTSSRNARAVNTQSVYVVGPESSPGF